MTDPGDGSADMDPYEVAKVVALQLEAAINADSDEWQQRILAWVSRHPSRELRGHVWYRTARNALIALEETAAVKATSLATVLADREAAARPADNSDAWPGAFAAYRLIRAVHDQDDAAMIAASDDSVVFMPLELEIARIGAAATKELAAERGVSVDELAKQFPVTPHLLALSDQLQASMR